jgi:hypothetical protein
MREEPLEAEPVVLLVEHHADLPAKQGRCVHVLLGIEGEAPSTKAYPLEALVGPLGSQVSSKDSQKGQLPDSHAVLRDPGDE